VTDTSEVVGAVVLCGNARGRGPKAGV